MCNIPLPKDGIELMCLEKLEKALILWSCLPLWMNVIECYDGSTHELHSVQFKFTLNLTLN